MVAVSGSTSSGQQREGPADSAGMDCLHVVDDSRLRLAGAYGVEHRTRTADHDDVVVAAAATPSQSAEAVRRTTTSMPACRSARA